MAQKKAKNDNIKGHGFDEMTAKEQRKIASMGGKASAKARKEKKALKECFEALLDMQYKTRDGKTATGAETLALTVFQKAQRGDLKAFELVRDTAGQKPIDKVMLAEVNQETIDDVENMVLGAGDADKESGC